MEEKIVKFSGFCEATFEADIYHEEVDGFIIQIDGVNYAAYVDPNDGYRSYGAFFETDQPCTNTFPPQEVILRQVEKEGGYDYNGEPKTSMTYLINPTTKEIILEAGTIWYDSYYPIGVCNFNPKAMPINKQKESFEGKTFEIIIEWHRDNGDHCFIGKMQDGSYIEGVIGDYIKFTPISEFNSLI